MMIFGTQRLEVEQLSIDNLNDFHRIYGDREIMKKIPTSVFSLEESKAELLAIIEAYGIVKHRLRVWGVFLRHNNSMIGVCASIGVSEQSREIGYRIMKEYWRQGFAKELVDGLINYLRQDSSIEFLTAEVDKYNIASIRILEKNMTFLKESYDNETDRYQYHYALNLK